MLSTRLLPPALAAVAIVGLHLAAATLAQESAKNGLTVAEFERLHKELQPSEDELWRTIPWHVSILEGREVAARSGKPIFVWVASGEPLGCG